ncbi:hypothetical protein A5657_08000 [Mycobacterium kubicae]|nr:hypothetical protein A5657_08000 [Mycobacterium kubicae]
MSNREIIMDVGAKDGVQIGMQFVVLGKESIEVGVGDDRAIEYVEVPKSIVKVVRLSGERLSIGRTFRTIKGRPAYEVPNPLYFGSRILMNDTMEPVRRIPAVPDRVETFDVNNNETIRGRFDMKVRKGDVVRLTTGDEFL